MALLNKNDSSALPLQICTVLRQRIREGIYTPGGKMDSIRKLAEEFETAPVTLMRALDILENEGIIRRIQGKGVFVARSFNQKNYPLTACFAFPEKQLYIPTAPEINALNSEFYRGLLQGAVNYDIKLNFSYFAPVPSPEEFAQQQKELEKFDFIIFPSYSQNKQLMQKTAQTKPVFTLQTYPGSDDSDVIFSSYDIAEASDKLFKLVLESGSRSVAAIGGPEVKKKAEDFLRRCAEAGLRTPENGAWIFENDKESDLRVQKLQQLLSCQKYDFLFCTQTDMLRDIYEAAFNLNLFIGQNINVSGIASGVTVSNLFPRYTYLKIPRLEQGTEIMRAASDFFRKGIPVQLEIFKTRLVTGQSVQFKN